MGDPSTLKLFNEFNKKYFWGKLDKVKLTWSPRMTLCAGKTAFKVRGSYSSCTIRLSQPLLTQRPHSDTVNTLLHEMIHAYLHVTQGLNYRDSHGPEFRNHMKRINSLHGSKITIYHNFHREVDKFRIHVYRCDGPCVSRRPFFGVLRRAIERPPGPTDRWWERHMRECGGTFRKIEGPDVKSTSVPQKLNGKYSRSEKGHIQSRNTKSYEMGPKSSQQSMKMKSFDEEKVLQRIKEKYSKTKQTKLLSVDETPGLHLRHNCKLVDGQMNYNYKQKSSRKINVDKYIRKFHEATKLSGVESSKPSVYVPKAKVNVSNRTSEKLSSMSPCPVCNSDVPNNMYEQHLEQCSREELNFDSDFEDDSTGSGIPLAQKQKSNSWDDLSDTKTCHNCGSVVLAAEMRLHLQYCIDSDDESLQETFSDETEKFNQTSLPKDGDSSNIVSCPSCMEKVHEKKIQEHLDQCLTFLAEEF